MLKRFSGKNFQIPSKSGTKMAVWGKGDVNVKEFVTLNRNSLARNRVYVFCINFRGGVLAVGDF